MLKKEKKKELIACLSVYILYRSNNSEVWIIKLVEKIRERKNRVSGVGRTRYILLIKSDNNRDFHKAEVLGIAEFERSYEKEGLRR